MKDELEKYIIEHRTEFDDYKVDKLKLWNKIDTELSKTSKKVIPLWKRSIFRVAASILILIGLSLSFFSLSQDNSKNQLVNEELHEIDNYYKTLLSNQIQLIKKTNLSDEEKADFLLLVDDLDKEYSKLKLELKEGINDQKIIEAIIGNYRKKIQLMENLLKKSYQFKNENDETEFIL